MGVMVHLRAEGWKEAKVASVSAAPVGEAGAQAEGELRLEKHSIELVYGMPSVSPTTTGPENYRRGVEKAKQVVCINDGAIWIWMMVFVCFPRRIEILDWWPHAAVRLADRCRRIRPDSAEAAAWVDAQKAALARSQLRLFFRRILRLYPLLSQAPPEVKKAVAYLWKNRRRMNYAAYRKAGFPISSGTVESAAKTLIQQRMKQAGMRWSRDGAQAMLALRARLRSERWHEIPI